jgi:hypothetical protein
LGERLQSLLHEDEFIWREMAQAGAQLLQTSLVQTLDHATPLLAQLDEGITPIGRVFLALHPAGPHKAIHKMASRTSLSHTNSRVKYYSLWREFFPIW